MSLRLKLGQRLLDGTSAGEFIVVRAPDSDVELTIGGQAPLLEAGDQPRGGEMPAPAVAAVIGKRYASADRSLELLCVKPGSNLPDVSGFPLEVVEPKPLPASD